MRRDIAGRTRPAWGWAIDAHIAMHQGARRLIAGCAERAGHRLVVPEKALEHATTRYRRIARTRARRISTLEQRDAAHPAPTDVVDAAVVERTIALARAFATWAKGEAQREDGLWTVASGTDRGQWMIESMLQAGVAQSTGANAEEDTVAAGQALGARCRWITSSTFRIFGGHALERWRERHPSYDQPLESVALPMVLTPDEALATLLNPNGGACDQRTLITAIAWELARPDDAQRKTGPERIAALERHADALAAEHLPAAARAIRCTLDATRWDPARTERALEPCGVRGRLERCRAAERRQIRAQRDALKGTRHEEDAPRGVGAQRSKARVEPAPRGIDRWLTFCTMCESIDHDNPRAAMDLAEAHALPLELVWAPEDEGLDPSDWHTSA